MRIYLSIPFGSYLYLLNLQINSELCIFVKELHYKPYKFV